MHHDLPTSTEVRKYAALTVAYFVTTGAAVGLTRFEGGVACIWIAAAVLLVGLISTPPRRWPILLAACAVAGGLALSIWGLGWRSAPWLALINVGEALVAASLVRYWRVGRSSLDSIRSLALFTLAAGIIAPAGSALCGAAVVSLFAHTNFASNYTRWFFAHGLGTVAFAPVFAFIANGEFGRWLTTIRRREALEAACLLLLVVVTSLAVFVQSHAPVLFLPVLPLMIVTFRLGRFGAAIAIVVIAVIGGVCTARGLGPVALIKGTAASHVQFFQFYLSITVLTVMPVAAVLTRRERLFIQLRDSEARFRLVTENSTDIIMNLHVDGTIRYVSPSITRFGDHDAKALLGRAAIDLIAEPDRARVVEVHRQALESRTETFSVEFRTSGTSGEERWFETHVQAVTGADESLAGLISVIRETSVRKRTEAELTHAANTDPLTGLSNRRAFDRKLQAIVDDRNGAVQGCVALFDLDHFKRVNDSFGHAIGDEVLKAFAGTAGHHVRASDMLARIGGEEFGLIFPSISIDMAAVVCERIRLAVTATPVFAGDMPVHVTVSIGIAPALEHMTADGIVRNADKALYEAKAMGRNRLSLAA